MKGVEKGVGIVDGKRGENIYYLHSRFEIIITFV